MRSPTRAHKSVTRKSPAVKLAGAGTSSKKASHIIMPATRSTLTSNYRAVVIGGGIVGVCVLHHLTRFGRMARFEPNEARFA
jgi:hypothetical protein